MPEKASKTFVRRYFYPLLLGALLAASAAVLYRLAQQCVPLGEIAQLLPGNEIHFYPEKTRETAWYLLLVPTFFFIFCACLSLRKKGFSLLFSDRQITYGLLCLTVFTLCVCFASAQRPIVEFLIYASALTALGGWFYITHGSVQKQAESARLYWRTHLRLRQWVRLLCTGAKVTLLTACLVFLFWFIKPFVFEKPFLLVEFPAISSQTVLLGQPTQTLPFVQTHLVLEQWNQAPDPLAAREFIALNEWDIIASVLDRFVLHHHAHLLNPIVEMSLGRPLNQIFIQYGFGNAWLIKKLMQSIGGINWQNYFKILFSFYYVYFALFLAAVWLVFKKLNYVLLASLGVLGALGAYGYVSLWVAPGANPIRHFFDVFVFVSLFYYFKTDRLRWLWLFAVWIILACLNVFSTGAALLIAAAAALFVRALEKPDAPRLWREIGVLCAASLGAMGVWFCVVTAGTDAFAYFLKGLLGFLMLPSGQFWLALLIVAGYLIYWLFSTKNTPYRFLFLFTFFYTQGMLMYYVWGSDTRHLMVVFPLCVLSALCALKLAEESLSVRAKGGLFMLLLAAGLCFAGQGIQNYQQEKLSIQTSKKGHILHQWPFANAPFISAMNPAPLQEAASLISTFSGEEKGVFMISQYDLFLPFLAGKYNAMPFISLPWFLTSQKEWHRVTTFLEEKKPLYLFVDTGINEPLPYEKITPASAYFNNLSAEASARKARYQTLAALFNKIRAAYKPVQKGELITVYERVDK